MVVQYSRDRCGGDAGGTRNVHDRALFATVPVAKSGHGAVSGGADVGDLHGARYRSKGLLTLAERAR
jgi:hypothetical protein